MLHITICDDDERFITFIKKIIIEAGADKETTLFSGYTSGEKFFFDLESGKECDLIIVDMQFGNMDGNDVAGEFRRMNPYSVLVFCSGIYMPTVKNFKTSPFRYLLKSYSDRELIDEMKEILYEVERRKREGYVVGHYRYNSLKIKINNIIYITNAKRGSKVHVVPGCCESELEDKILLDNKLEDLYLKYKKCGFEFASARYIVNLYYVKQIKQRELILLNDERLTISRKYYAIIYERFIKYIASKYNE